MTEIELGDNQAKLVRSNCLDYLQTMPADSVDTVITDPPYHLVQASRNGSSQPGDLSTPFGRSGPSKARGFMGKEWDGGDIAFRPETWSAILRVCKPGALLLAFGGTRTFHRLACAIEDAGWEIRDTICWLYSSGFPKSHNVANGIDKLHGAGNRGSAIASGSKFHATTGKARRPGEQLPKYQSRTPESKGWAGYGTALKPAFEPVIVAMKPLDGTYAENALKHGVAGLNIDGGRIDLNGDYKCGANWRPSQTGLGDNYDSSKANQHSDVGRWPANLVLDEDAGQILDQQTGTLKSGKMRAGTRRTAQDHPGSVCYGTYGGNATGEDTYGDSGGASRFFKCFSGNPRCVLCGDTFDSRVQATERESCPNSNTSAENAGSVSKISQATKESSALDDAAQTRIKKIVQNAKSAATLCDSCAIDFARILVEIRCSDFKNEESPVTRDSIGSCKNYTLIRSLACCAASLESTDTIPTIQSLSRLFGSVMSAIADFISPAEREVGAADNGPALATRFKYAAKASRRERGDFNIHPTVKPIALMEYLCRLTKTPTGGTVLDPFMGSGSTGVACVREGRKFIGIELGDEYFEIARKRVQAAIDERSGMLL